MKEYRFLFQMIFRLAFSMLPAFLGSPFLAVVLCANTAAVYMVSGGVIIGAICALASVLLALLFVGGATGFSLGLAIAAAALASGGCVRGKASYLWGVISTAAGYLLPTLLGYYQIAHSDGMNIIEKTLREPIDENMPALVSLLKESGIPQGSELLNSYADILVKVAPKILPSMFIMGALLAGYGIMWFTSARYRGTEYDNHHSFSEIRVDISGIIFTLLFIAAAYYVKWDFVQTIASNAAIVMMFVLSAAGLSLIDLYFRRSGISAFFRVILYGAAFMGLVLFSGVFKIAVNPILILPVVGLVASLGDIVKGHKKAVKGNG